MRPVNRPADRPVERPDADETWGHVSGELGVSGDLGVAAAGPTELMTPVTPVTEPGPDAPDAPTGVGEPAEPTRSRRRAAIIAGAAVGVLAALYGLDLALTSSDVPRGVQVAGVDIGGMSPQQAERALREQLGPRLDSPIAVRAVQVEATVDPAAAGLSLDWPGTLSRAGDQPLNPFIRLTSFFIDREVGVVTRSDPAMVVSALSGLREKTDRAPVEGGIRFEEAVPVAVRPESGQELDVDGAVRAVLDGWARGETIELPVREKPVTTSNEAVEAALRDVARPAVAAPVVVHGEGKDAKLEPAAIAAGLSFEPDGAGGLAAKLDTGKLQAAVQPQLASTEKEGKDAAVVFTGDVPKVTPSVDGKQIKWDTAFGPLLEVLRRGDKRELTVEYTTRPAKVTTEQATKLGVTEVIGEFTTKGFAADSGVNIRVVAEKVNGAIVKPGDTFSLNGFTGPRGQPQGYVEAGVIKDGAPGREVGGGISQFATTLYNAAYFAGMKDAGHKEHSYFISRYPPAREATVFQNHDGSSVIDLKFTNDSPTAVAIQTVWTPSSITVKLWGTKRYVVESVTGERTAFVEPPTKPGPPENCKASTGAQGFTVSDTRVIKDLSGREVRRDTRTVKYNPSPTITCG